MSWDQNVGWSHTSKIDNSSSERVEQFKYFGITVMNHNSIQEEVVKSLYKKGDKTSMTNYRPVLLLTVFSEVLKKAVHSRVNQHVHPNNILVTEQYSFRKGI